MSQSDPKPRPDPIPSPRGSTVDRFRRAMRLLAALAVLVAGIAVVLVADGDPEIHIHMLIATFLGVVFMILVGGALMTLVFMSASSGHDQAAADFRIDGDE